MTERISAKQFELLRKQGWDEYKKVATVMAKQMDEDFEVETLEGTMKGKAGDYLCQGPAGEEWPIKKGIFEATYVVVRTLRDPDHHRNY